MVAGDKITHVHNVAPKVSVVQQLQAKLQGEIQNDEKVRTLVESLQFFYTRKSLDGVDGLEAKLKAGQREDELYLALEKKELFVKLLERWSLYASAQEIFAYLLARAEHEFSMFVYPHIGEKEKTEINHLINERIVEETINECGANTFSLNHSSAMGMLYWLAEQCFVRWHK